MSLNTRVLGRWAPEAALQLDWADRFECREARTGAWDDSLLPALKTVFDGIERYVPSRPIIANGRLSIPAAFALGAAALAPRGRELSWNQYTVGRSSQLWSLGSPAEDAGFAANCSGSKLGASDLAVLISVTQDVEPAFAATLDIPPFRAVVKVRPLDQRYPRQLATPGQARKLAGQVIEAIRAARSDYHITGTIHVFFAGPVGLAVLIGQLTNTLGQLQTYEHIPQGAIGTYRRAALLEPGI